ncbi:MAG TPA: ATP-binding protein, partial [Saprospiraceae bacterium]|nr:ATP-binding protein [Saprospiraceae bacterium]
NIDPGVDISSTFVPPMIIQPYVENAIWHGLLHRHKPGGRLTIRIWRDDDLLHIQVEDNGVGRTEAARLKSKSATTHKSHGLKITAERMDIVNRIYNVDAKVDITDVQGPNGSPDGTRVSLTLLDKMYDSYHRG